MPEEQDLENRYWIVIALSNRGIPVGSLYDGSILKNIYLKNIGYNSLEDVTVNSMLPNITAVTERKVSSECL